MRYFRFGGRLIKSMKFGQYKKNYGKSCDMRLLFHIMPGSQNPPNHAQIRPNQASWMFSSESNAAAAACFCFLVSLLLLTLAPWRDSRMASTSAFCVA